MTRALLVDLGQVLVGFDRQITCRRVSEATGVPAGRLEAVLFGDLEAAFDRGALTPERFFRSCEERAGLPRLADAIWTGAWRDIFHPLPEAVATLGRVRSGVRRVLVSNTNELHWQGVLDVFDPAAALDALVLSFRVGAVKPEPAFWDAALEAAGCEAAECLFADDRPELVAAAAARGIPGFAVAGPESFSRSLASRGLLEEEGARPGNSGDRDSVRIS